MFIVCIQCVSGAKALPFRIIMYIEGQTSVYG